MNKHKKVMVFIARPTSNSYKWLTRRNAPNPEHGGDRWYVVTGNVEPNETLEHAVIREVKEETGIDSCISIIKLPITHTYTSRKDSQIEIEEQAYVLITNFSGAIVLNEESTDSRWLPLKDFVDAIWWPKDRLALQEVLEKAVNDN